MIGGWVVVRTFSAGVHFGILKSIQGTACEMEQARNIWSWEGANSLNEVANHGVAENSKITEPVDRLFLTQAIQIIPVTEKAKQNLMRSRWN